MEPKGITKLVALLLAWSFGVTAQTSVQPLDVAKLVREVQRTGEASSKRVFDFSWTSRVVVRWFNKSGRVAKEVDQEYEVFPSPGLLFVSKKLVKENGAPLSAKRKAKEQERLDAEMLRAELSQDRVANTPAVAKKADGACLDFGIWTTISESRGKESSLGTSDFLCFGEFFSPRIERKEGRDTAILFFRPAATLPPHPAEKAVFAKLVGVIWIDMADHTVTHIEAWPVENPRAFTGQGFSFLNPPISIDDVRLPAGMWVRRRVYIDTRKDPLSFNGVSLEWKQDFSDYKLYSAQPPDYKIADPNAQSSPP